jgi:hypothetical protein
VAAPTLTTNEINTTAICVPAILIRTNPNSRKMLPGLTTYFHGVSIVPGWTVSRVGRSLKRNLPQALKRKIPGKKRARRVPLHGGHCFLSYPILR